MAELDHVEDSKRVEGRGRAAAPRCDGPKGSPLPPPAFPAGVVRILQSSNDNWLRDPEPGPASELDCLRHVLAPTLLRAAEARGREVEIGADQALIRSGVINEDTYLQTLSLHTGLAIETFADASRADCALPDRHLPRAAEHGLLPLRRDGKLIWAIAPRGFGARRLCRLTAMYPSLCDRVRLTSTRDLNQFLLRRTGDVLGQSAANALGRRFPALSAAPVADGSPRGLRAMRRRAQTGALAVMMTLTPASTLDIGGSVLAVWFLAFIGLRLAASLRPLRPTVRPPRTPDGHLPVYTVIAALYREAASVAPLMQAIGALDYPREKLDVIIVIELDDLETRAALARLGPMPQVQVLLAPAIGPRTKPKALNCALPFARGSFTAVFDAEDRPDPGQLRAALDAFRTQGTDVACVQASLCIENQSDSWLSRMFAAEYAGQFDVFLPGLASFGVPLPLGGSSNHFRTAVLREVGGWDAYNVTEDADLGFRLARFGYRSTTFVSTTFEEAPVRFGGWLRQRSRWMKGWMQTWSVHMRRPWRLWWEAGAKGFLTLNAVVGGNVLTALAFPVLVVNVAFDAMARFGMTDWFAANPVTPLHWTTIAAGFVSTIVVALMGLARRGQLRQGWILALTPVYWACLSIAAWRALYQLLSEPYRWEKTEHGLSSQIRSNAASQTPASRAMATPRRQRYR
ncbi:glycosyltransferase family 2 protein [Nitrobacter sp. NHB1]|uniref:glycosyltransferase family 2 protein n=1 Tax=Nitrobacter sp. NHB1 TaxID=3119830 RepID=UPI002FFF49DC